MKESRVDRVSLYLNIAADAANLLTALTVLVCELRGLRSRDGDQPRG